jgi:hypothetical protein
MDPTDMRQAFCVRCHTSIQPSGVTVPSSIDNVRRLWVTDPHGATKGIGFRKFPVQYGGTLKAPYTRQSASMSCTECHDHSNTSNLYKLKTTVNGKSVSVASATQADSLCSACHEGGPQVYHADCIACHAGKVGQTSHVDGHALNGIQNFVGSNCFSCHQHGETQPRGSCHDCHDVNQM